MLRSLVFGSLVVCVGSIAYRAHAIEGYADVVSYSPGETIVLHVSSPEAYRIELLRFGAFEDPFDRPDVLVTMQGATASLHQTDFGSFVETPVRELPRTSLTVEAWVNPTIDIPGYYQAIMSQSNTPNEQVMSLVMIGGTRQIGFPLSGDGTNCAGCVLVSTNGIALQTWTHVVATYDGTNKRIYLNGVLDSVQAYSGGIAAVDEPVRIAALASGGTTITHFNGKLDAVTLYDVALTPEQVSARWTAGATQARPAPLAGALFQYDFEDPYGSILVDSTSNRRNASLPSGGTGGVSGPGAFGPAMRFAQDDFIDAGWPATDMFDIPTDWPSGLYAVRLVESTSGAEAYVMFVLRPANQRARLAVVASTNTWLAYNGWPSNHSLYNVHYDSSPNYFVAVRRPNPGANPYVLYIPTVNYAHLVYAERFLHSWLEHEGRPYDMYSDVDLHDGRIPLNEYRALVFAGHSEYWSTEMRDHVAGYVNAGGNVLSMSGNTAYWKVTFDADRRVMEGRKWAGPTGQGMAAADERVHAQTGERGGLWGVVLRGELHDDYDVFGVATDSIISPDVVGSGFTVLAPEHWAFEGLGLVAGSRIGTTSRNGRSAVGHETDASSPVLSPPELQVLARGTGVAGNRLNLALDDTVSFIPTTEAGEITSYTRPGGGTVFTIASVGSAGSLGVDAPLSGVVCKVLSRFTSQEEEVCDGIDNDCDGKKDDDARCDDGNPCTQDRGECANDTCEYIPIPGCGEVDSGSQTPDAGKDRPRDDGGCGCSFSGRFTSSLLAWLFVGLLLAARLRRRSA